jgi:hypothetical protein
MDAADYGNYGYGHFTAPDHGQAFRHRVGQGNSLAPDANFMLLQQVNNKLAFGSARVAVAPALCAT